MNPPDLDTSVPDWLIEYPQLLRMFEKLDIDSSCGGKSLEFACSERSLDPEVILRQIWTFLHNRDDTSSPDG